MNKSIKTISFGILTALLFSSFIYFEEYDLTNKLVNTITALLALGLFLYIPKRSVLVAGFFIGLFWFYWIGYSFEYQGVGYLTPVITLSFGIIYLLFFMPLYFTDKPYIRAFILFGLSFVEPFDWNWLQVELLFVESYLGVYKYQLALILAALSIPVLIQNKKYRFLPLLIIIFAFNYGYPSQKDAPLKIKLIQTDVKQEKKWKRESLNPTIQMIFTEIQKAIDEKYHVVVLPESVFPIYMNHNPQVLDILKNASKNIVIVAGTLITENSAHYNVTYKFEDGEYAIAKKLVLVPFGEYIPLPKFAQDFINEKFFSGTSDFVTASEPTDFLIKGVKFRNAICYEATCSEIYEGEVDFIIATSNNAWFTPSIEPTLQRLLMRYYARKNGVTIYHSANYKGSGIIK
ncbi:apolipoprotein N-acyltransferase [Sulfurimonas aquatica]|uniref:Apolipoprotein N-acyltransferase n=1 Tax=Sulfurimonas aquatica TaxID=2672570 RepID=A0A975GCB6_9BACT|nr:apolipoprotein N-acyltransferase [Sulfurimonas aquatica]QSZ41123.1 apolipoprotein N-acyltransferase [Sulfurimonas aquatica]